MQEFREAREVREGSVLAVVAPSGPFDVAAFEKGVAWLRERYEVRYDAGIYERAGYLAGGDARRLAELRAAVGDGEVDAIVCARGGYGAGRIVEGLEVERVKRANKVVVGFSDITALHGLWARAGVRSVHGKMVADLGRAEAGQRERWVEVVEGAVGERRWEVEAVCGGVCEGRLFGGNLALLVAMLGTGQAPPVDGCLLLIEDVGERPYRVDRMLTQLGQAGWGERVAGVVLGAFTEGVAGADGVTLDEVLCERLGGWGVPVVKGVPVGHIEGNEAVVLGATAKIGDGFFSV